MRTMQPRKNIAPKLLGAGLLLAVCGFLFLSGCQNALQTPEVPGTLLLTINRQGAERTIRPETALDHFVRFDLEFVAVSGGNTNFTREDWTKGSSVELGVGTWNLHVTAFLPSLDEDGQPIVLEAARGSLEQHIEVAPGQIVTGNIELFPIPEGQGTFSWNISFSPEVVDNIAIARIEIRRNEWDGVPVFGPFYFVGGNMETTPNPGYLPLDAGRYFMVLALYNHQGERAGVGATLHVYHNMESSFAKNFTLSDFPVSLLDFVLGAWDGLSWNFTTTGIAAGHFDFLGIGGVYGHNFDEIEYHLTQVTNANDNNIPATEAGLKALVDAARISIAILDPAFTRATFYWGSDDAEEAITNEAINVDLEVANFNWTGVYTVTVTVGAYAVDVVFVPVPVTSVRITSPTPAPTDANPYRLEVTHSWDFTAEVGPSDARYREVKWEIPDSAHEDFVEITEYNEVTGTARIYGLSAGLAHVYAVSMANDTHRVRVPIDVFPLGAGIPITDIAITNTDPITLEVGDDADLVIVRTPGDTTQLGITVTGSASGIVTIDGLRITGVYPGTVTVTVAATANPSVYDTITVIVPPTPRTVEVSPTTAGVPRNRTQQFSHTVLHGAGGYAGVPQGVTWTATPEEYATINNDGLLTLLPTATIDGTVTVRATTTHANAVYGESTVTVLPPVPETIDITAVDATITGGAITVTMGTPQTFNAIVGPEGALQGVTWSVVPISGASTAGAEISSGDVLTTVAPLVHGNMFTVRATVNALPTLSADVTVTINVTPTGINITGYAGEIARGSTAPFTAQVLPHPAASQAVNWSVHAYPGHPAAAPTGVTIPGGVLTLTADADVSYNQVLVVRAAVPGTGFVATRQVTVTVIPTSVVITSPTPPAVAAHRGTSLAFAARVEPYSAASQAVVWSVAEAESGADFIGNVLQIPSGLLPYSILTITATAAGVPGVVSAPLTVTVTTPAPTGVQVTPTGVAMGRGQTWPFSAAVLPDGGPGGVAYGHVVWSVDSAPVGVMINHYGELTIAAGASVYHGDTLTVRATAYSTAISGTATVIVRVPPEAITVTRPAATVTRGTTLEAFTAVAGPAGAYQGVSWSVSPTTGGVSINPATGVLTVPAYAPLHELTVTATTSFPGSTISGIATITVISPVPVVTVDPNTDVIVRGGESRTFTASMTGAAGIDYRVNWSIEPPNAATITSYTDLTATVQVTAANTAIGSFTIRATAVGHLAASDSATVTVLIQEGFVITFADLQNMSPEMDDIELPGIVGLFDDPPPRITIRDPEGVFDDIRWFIRGGEITGGAVVDDGATLVLDSSVHDGRIGRHRVTVEVLVGDRTYSRIVAFTVVP